MQNDAGGTGTAGTKRRPTPVGRAGAMWVGGALVLTVAIGCEKEGRVTGAPMPAPSTRELGRGPVAPALFASPPLSAPIRAVPRPQAEGAPVPVDNTMVDARLLVIATDGQEQELAAVEDALQFMGSPYDKMIATSAAPLTAAQLADGAHGKYSGVILTRGGLLYDGTAGTVS